MRIRATLLDCLGKRLLDASTAADKANGAVGAVHDHAPDGGGRAGHAGVGAAAGSVVVLHQAWVADRGGGRGEGVVDADAAFGLLHDDGEDEARVDARGVGD